MYSRHSKIDTPQKNTSPDTPEVLLIMTSEGKKISKKTKSKASSTDNLTSDAIILGGDGALNPIWTHSPQITQLCGLCCVEETTTKRVYCDSFPPIEAVGMQFLLPPGQKKKGVTTKTWTTVKTNKQTNKQTNTPSILYIYIYQNWYRDYRLSSLLRVVS